MNTRTLYTLLAGSCLAFAAAPNAFAELVYATNNSGVYGYPNTPKLPWCEWRVHDANRPAPPRIDPGPPGSPVPAPSDAIVLFDGTDTKHWGALRDWKVENAVLISGNTQLVTREHFGDIQLHVEWLSPKDFDGPWYDRGNNGVVLMGQFEIQIFDSYNEKIYPDGQCAAIYGQTPPMVNVTRPPGQWQSFDIFFKAPVFEEGVLKSPPRVTVLHNGVLVHLNEEIHGELSHKGLPQWKRKTNSGPLVLGGHGCPVQFRNIWLRKL
jgi:hypothetical protein